MTRVALVVCSDGLAAVRIGYMAGYIDRTGTYVFPLTDCLTQEEKEEEGWRD